MTGTRTAKLPERHGWCRSTPHSFAFSPPEKPSMLRRLSATLSPARRARPQRWCGEPARRVPSLGGLVKAHQLAVFDGLKLLPDCGGLGNKNTFTTTIAK